MKYSVSSVSNFIFTLICISGCVYQVINVGVCYFSYGTVTQNRYHAPIILSYPQLHICFLAIEDAIDWPSLGVHYSVDLNNAASGVRWEWSKNLTIEDMIKYSHQFDIIKCIYRDATGLHRIKDAAYNCTFFNITKYIQQQYVCYRLTPIKNNVLNFDAVHSSLFYERMLYDIEYGGQLSRATKIRPTLTDHSLPYLSRRYTPSFYKNSDEESEVQVSCSNFSNSRLGYPYDKYVCSRYTFGFEYDYYDCLIKCLNQQTLKMFDKKSVYAFHDNCSDASKILNYEDLNNATKRVILSNIYRRCTDACPEMMCKYSYCVTTGWDKATKISPTDAANNISHQHSHVDNMNNHSISSLRVESTPTPNIEIKYIPSLPLLDFIIYILSTLGCWFGFVVISFSPAFICSVIVNVIKRMKNMNNVQTLKKNEFRRSNRQKKVIIIDKINDLSYFDEEYFKDCIIHVNNRRRTLNVR